MPHTGKGNYKATSGHKRSQVKGPIKVVRKKPTKLKTFIK